MYIAVSFLIIGISRIAQRWFFEKDRFMNVAVTYGCIYVLLGLGMLVQIPLAYATIFLGGWILPILGIGGGLYRYFKYQRKGLLLCHVALDILLFVLLMYALFGEQSISVPVMVQCFFGGGSMEIMSDIFGSLVDQRHTNILEVRHIYYGA